MKKIDLGRLFLQSIIVHEIPKHSAKEHQDELPLSEIPPPANTDILNFLRERIIETISKHGIEIEFDQKTSSPMPEWVRKHLHETAELVDMSQEMARHLYLQQTGVNPAGLLTVASSIYKGKPALIIMKLQREEGVRFQRIRVDGHETLGLEHLRELLLTQKTRVFKAALFIQEKDILCGWASDEQVKDLANFFVTRFLGCRPARKPATLTKTFFDTASKFIRDRVDDADQKLRYRGALQTELNSHREAIRPREWIRDYIDTEHRADFEAAFAQSDVPLEKFHKDISRLTKSNLKRTRANTSRGLSLAGDTDTFHEIVHSDEINGKKTIVIHDYITDLAS